MFKRKKNKTQIEATYEEILESWKRSNDFMLEKFDSLTDKEIFELLKIDRQIIHSCEDLIDIYKES